MSTVLITGAGSGIGLALSALYHERGDRVIASCRSLSPELKALGVELVEGVDVSDEHCASRLLQALQGSKLDLLINNAGVFGNNTLGEIDFGDVLHQLQVNAIAPLRITQTLLPALHSGAKIAMMTSRMSSMADNGSGAYYGYRMSKAALNAASMSLARDLQSRGVAVALLHPGFVNTKMVNFGGEVSPQQAAQGLAERIDALTLETSGGFWHANGEMLPW